MYTCLLYEVRDGVATITLNRPDVFNAFNDPQSYELQDALKQVARDAAVRAVVLTGAGRAFCSGQDLKAAQGVEKRSFYDSLHQRYNPIIRAMPAQACYRAAERGGGRSGLLPGSGLRCPHCLYRCFPD